MGPVSPSPARRSPAPAAVALVAATLCAFAAAQETPPPPGDPPVNPTPAGSPSRENRLAREKSPYLLQHARNPVDWFPWGDEAFALARESGRPVFLSIGYSTCHWCHVMERESFENAEIARFLNANFVAVKVDREERPDVDAVYMAALQAMGQGGGWPLSAFLAPDGRPFFLGTYFPPEDRHGRPGFLTVLRKIDEAWRTRREDVLAAGADFTRAVAEGAHLPAPGEPGAATLPLGVAQMARRFDPLRGGFAPEPKFPRAHALSFLLREAARTGDGKAREMAIATLDAMAAGGIHDHVGGGFHRYSTDGEWLVPHFEKMLYDEALLLAAYAEAAALTGEARFARVARDIVAYAVRDLRHPDGGFYAAEDADSEGVEGKFYLWTTAELREVLGPADAPLALTAWAAREQGNFRGEAEEAPPGANILHHARTRAEIAAAAGITEAALDARLEGMRARLLARRAARVRPHLDGKVLAGWNGLMISALARAGRLLDDRGMLDAASAAADFCLARLRSPEGRLLRRWCDGEAAGPAMLEDHALLALGLLDLYEAGFDPRRLEAAVSLAGAMRERFADGKSGAFWTTAHDAEPLIARTREAEDWAVPSGNSAAALLLLRLGRLLGDPGMEGAGRGVLRAWSGGLESTPAAFPAMLAALEFDLGPTREIVVAGDPADPRFAALRREIDRRFLPRVVVAARVPGPAGEALVRLAPWLRDYGPVEGAPAAYVCSGGTCRAPVTTAAALAAILDGP